MQTLNTTALMFSQSIAIKITKSSTASGRAAAEGSQPVEEADESKSYDDARCWSKGKSPRSNFSAFEASVNFWSAVSFAYSLILSLAVCMYKMAQLTIQ